LRQLIRVKEQFFGTVDLMFSASLASETAGIRLNALDLGAARNAETGIVEAPVGTLDRFQDREQRHVLVPMFLSQHHRGASQPRNTRTQITTIK
jgi:hypothetical protein